MEPTLYYLGAMFGLPVSEVPGHGFTVRNGKSRSFMVLGTSAQRARVRLVEIAGHYGRGAQA